jgi:hypothetical protein
MTNTPIHTWEAGDLGYWACAADDQDDARAEIARASGYKPADLPLSDFRRIIPHERHRVRCIDRDTRAEMTLEQVLADWRAECRDVGILRRLPHQLIEIEAEE